MKIIALFGWCGDGDGYPVFPLKKLYFTLEQAQSENPKAKVGKRADHTEDATYGMGPDILEEIEIE